MYTPAEKAARHRYWISRCKSLPAPRRGEREAAYARRVGTNRIHNGKGTK